MTPPSLEPRADPHPLPRHRRLARRPSLRRHDRTRHHGKGAAARNEPDRRNSQGAEMNARVPTPQRLVTSFLEAIASERGASRNTIEAYRRDLSAYVDFLAARGAGALAAT